jgi:hypothetical protein
VGTQQRLFGAQTDELGRDPKKEVSRTFRFRAESGHPLPIAEVASVPLPDIRTNSITERMALSKRIEILPSYSITSSPRAMGACAGRRICYA